MLRKCVGMKDAKGNVNCETVRLPDYLPLVLVLKEIAVRLIGTMLPFVFKFMHPLSSVSGSGE